jgi:hypothetical protein
VPVLLWLLVTAVGTYVLFLAVMFAVMCQPPVWFGRTMRYFPMWAMPLVPFPAMWSVARRGSLRIGDDAPDFELPLLDRTRNVTLSAFRGDRPVVLVFGSYT